MSFLLLRDDQRITGPVTGAVDADFVNSWLVDGRPSFPVKTTGDMDLTVTPSASMPADFFAIHSHTVNAAGGAVLKRNGGTPVGVLTPAWNEDGVPLNPFLRLGASVSVGSLNIAVASNTGPVVVGELYAGVATVLESPFLHGYGFDPGAPFGWESQLAPTDDGLSSPRRAQGSLILTPAGFATLQSCWLASRRGTRPTPIVPDDSVNDMWLAQFQYNAVVREGYYFTTLQLVEIPRTRW